MLQSSGRPLSGWPRPARRRKTRAVGCGDGRAHVLLAALHAGGNAPALPERRPPTSPTRTTVLASQHSEPRAESQCPSALPIDQFIDYGLWVQRQVAPVVDSRPVVRIDHHRGRFRLTLADDDAITAAQVEVAAGIAPFASRPQEFDQLPPELASHSSDHSDLSVFSGRNVAVGGAGQSALESAALLARPGARSRCLPVHPACFFRRKPWLDQLGPSTRLMFAPAEVGPAGLSRLVALPGWYRRLPRELQDRFAVRSLRPAGAAWLIPRLREVPITRGVVVTGAKRMDGTVRLTLDDGSERCVDHVLLATVVRPLRFPAAGSLSARSTESAGIPVSHMGSRARSRAFTS